LQLKQFSHCDELKSYLISTNEQQNTLIDYTLTLPVDSPTTDNGSEQAVSQPAVNSVTGTNNQVAGVDEADFVKTSGDYTYLLSGGYLVILQTWPADQTQELSRTEIDGTPRTLFFHDDIVLVVSDLTQQSYPQYEDSLAVDIAPRINQMTKVTLLQVSDPRQPTLIRETVFESDYVDARKIGQQVYLVVRAQLDLNPVLDDPDNVEIDELLPVQSDNTAPSTNAQPTTSVICGCDAIYRPETANGTGTTTILSFDLANPLAEIPRQSVLGNSNMVYANQENLYIASVEDSNWLWLSVVDGAEEEPTPSTTIHKFSLQSSLQYLASGRVEGHLLNQFAMDEYQGALRLVTTEQTWWTAADPENRLFVMEQSGSQLVERAQLDGLGKPGESVYAVRFDQDRGYLVTFEQIDPLITLDLSDADNPRVAGELEVPGFSSYLHPIEGDMILAIGHDTDTNGIKLSLFDISDFSQPVLLNEHLVGAGSYSEAAYNHHAFTWFEQERMLAIPVTHWNSSTPEAVFDTNDIFNGLELFRVSAQQGIEPYASIDHDIFYQNQTNSRWLYPEGIRRSFFVSDEAMNSYIYSISERGLLVNDLTSPETNLAEIELPTDSDYVYLFNEAQLTRFDSCDEVKSFLIDTNQQQNQLLSYVGASSGSDFSSAPISGPASLPDFDAGQSESQPTVNSVTGTNNQVAGVDEADFIKTNGNHTYLLSGGNLVVLQTWPADQSQELSRTQIDGTPMALFLYEDMVWVVSDLSLSYPQFAESLAADFAPRVNRMTKVMLYRVSDPRQPTLIRETVFESGYVDARRIGQQVYLIVSALIDLSPALDDPVGTEVADLLPILADNKAPGTATQPDTSTICGCDAIYRPDIPNGTGTLTILNFDLANPLADITSQTILGNTGLVYANQDNLYIASVEDDYWTWLPVIQGGVDPTVTTTIHKFSLQSSPQYLASGRVEGHLLNQFAMDEYQGVLRLVTTEQAWWSGVTENRLYVLAQAGEQLAERAYLDGLGKPGESVYAVRFDEERGYVVTFQQIDPLITLDLSDDRNPLVAGELEVPGFSTYLHPIEGDMILAIGTDTATWGIKLSLFDISNFSQPQLLYDHLLGSGYTEAAYNHHAFTWFEQEKMLAIPVTQWGNPLTGTTFGYNDIFNGLELFRVTAQEGIQPYASIDHDIFYKDPESPYFHYPESVRRSFFVTDDAMNNYIYSISGRGFLVNDLASPNVNLAEIELPSSNTEYLY
jgi:uncharacterized secreted protein with C-terminal beta-propeller domain